MVSDGLQYRRNAVHGVTAGGGADQAGSPVGGQRGCRVIEMLSGWAWSVGGAEVGPFEGGAVVHDHVEAGGGGAVGGGLVDHAELQPDGPDAPGDRPLARGTGRVPTPER